MEIYSIYPKPYFAHVGERCHHP